jgi:outer membrane protein assembly factor BamB
VENLVKRIVILALLGCVVVGATVTLLERRAQTPPGESAPLAPEGLSPAQEEELLRITTLGYIAGNAPASDTTGVLVDDTSAACDGPTLFSYAKGPVAVLIDMSGRVLHTWSRPGSDNWARVHLYGNGDLLVITNDPYHLMKIDAASQLVWMYEQPAHHDFDVLPDGSIWVIIREITSREKIHGGGTILDDALAHVDPGGHEMTRVSLLTAFERSDEYASWVSDAALPAGTDILHTNSVQILDHGRRALVSMRTIDAVAMVDLRTDTVVWALKGPWRNQHEAQLVGGELLLFDNAGLGDRSRVLEIDPATSEIVWSYTSPGFVSGGAGAEQRLPNGDTLITESEKGRIVEVARDGRIVWEYVNPLTVPDEPEVTLGIMRAERLPRDFPLGWATETAE